MELILESHSDMHSLED